MSDNVFNTYKNVKCAAPFSAIFIKKNHDNVIINPCCAMDHKSFSASLEQDKDLNYNFNKLIPIREEFISKSVAEMKDFKACGSCAILKEGQRLHYNHLASYDDTHNYVDEPKVKSVHLTFSNKCNLACRICGSSSSSLWAKEAYLNSSPNHQTIPVSNFIDQFLDTKSLFYKSLLKNIKDIKNFWFSGGEPFLHEEMWELLSHCESIDHLNLSIFYNTNGTVKFSKKEIQLLKKFQHISIEVSIDGLFDQAEYIRTGLDWNSWIRNFDEYYKEFKDTNIFLSVCITASVYNIYNLDEIYIYFKNKNIESVNINYVGPNSALSIARLPLHAKDYIKNKFVNNKNLTNVLTYLDSNESFDYNKVITTIENQESIALKYGLYKKFKPFEKLAPEWVKILKFQKA